MYFKVLNLEYVPGYGSGIQLYSCTNDIVWDTNTTCMYEYSMYPDTSTSTHLFIRRVPVLRPRTAVPEGIRQGTSILNLVCTGTF